MAPQRGPVLLAAPLGAWSTNFAVLGDRSRAEAVIVDPGQGADEVIPAVLERLEVRPVAVLLTHAHFDHLWSAPDLARTYGMPVLLHPDDMWLWSSPPAAFGPDGDELAAEFGFVGWDTADVEVAPLVDGQRLNLAGISLSVHHTPGHTPGHVTFATDDLAGCPVEFDGRPVDAPAQVLLSGDLLFAGSIGRTDRVGGDPQVMMRSLERTMSGHTDTTVVIPGHGPVTTVGVERATNPFLEAR
jgi:hydroxyacylglutathione hydrolase